MSKRIIVVDDCIDCPYEDCVPVMDYFVRKCRAAVGCIIEGKIPPDWCPLPEMPERWTPETEDYSRCADVEYYAGWNECLDEIDGGGEDE